MKKNIWILNHYATDMGLDKGGRHYWFAENLIKKGYKPIIICASSIHKSTNNLIKDKENIKFDYFNNIPFIFLKTNNYIGNGKDRIKNMVQYFWQIFRNYKKIEEKFGKPDAIIGSSVHPLACLAALILGKKYNIKKIIEIRDLWPETLLMMGIVKEKTILSWLLYKGEKYLYKKADNIIFTMEGGKQYIIDKGWDREISLSKVYYINNGIDLEKFRELENNSFVDEDLDNDKFRIIYTGTIARVNNLKRIVDVAEIMKENNGIQFLIYGDGDEKQELEKYCKFYKLKNIKFKGRVLKEKIPYILSKAHIVLFNGQNMENNKYNVMKYGISSNKLFDYLASNKIILQTFRTDYNPIEKYKCGFVSKKGTSKELTKLILKIKELNSVELENIKLNMKNCIKNYDFVTLTEQLIDIIEN